MNRKPSKVSWGPELQAVNQAFAALEEELRCEIALQENRSVQLAAASAQLKEREQELEQLLNSALQDRSDLAQQAVAAGAQIKQLEASLNAMTQQLAERRADLEASQANLARQQHLRDGMQAQLDSASQSLLRLEEEAKVGRLNAAQAALDGQRAADLAVQSRLVQEALERQLKSLLESLQFERTALLAAQKAHDERDRQCARQDTHIAELRTRLSDESARADHALERLSQLRRAADETVDALKRDSQQLRAEVALQQQNSRADALARESQLHEHWRRQEAATAIEHAQAQARLRDRVAELQASLADQEDRKSVV